MNVRQRRVVHADLAKLVLELDQFGKIRDHLCLPRLAKLDRRVDETAGNRKGGERLQDDPQDLQLLAVHAQNVGFFGSDDGAAGAPAFTTSVVFMPAFLWDSSDMEQKTSYVPGLRDST